MTISLLQLNTFADTFWETLTTYLSSHDFDILHLQEMSGDETIVGALHSNHDTFKELQKLLGDKYNSELAIAETFTSHPSAYLGNATFYKKDFTLLEKKIVEINPKTTPFPSTAHDFEKEARCLLHLKLNLHGKEISFLNTHLAWAKTPTEEPHQTKQAEKLITYLQNLSGSYILSGDFNIDPQQPTIQKLNTLAQNLTSKYNITNTLNPQTHRAKVLFPEGVAVDYIYISNDLTAKKMEVIQENFSDHFGLTAEIEI